MVRLQLALHFVPAAKPAGLTGVTVIIPGKPGTVETAYKVTGYKVDKFKPKYAFPE